MDRYKGAPQACRNPGIATRDVKQAAVPVYGTDISVRQALQGSTSFDYTTLTTHGIELQVARDTLDAIDAARDCSCRVAAFLLCYPSTLYQTVDKSNIILDIECGDGFSGIAALQLGYTHVIFADLSIASMRDVVWPNIMINYGNDVSHVRCVASANWVALSEYLSDPGPNKWTVIYKRFGAVLMTISTINNSHMWEKLHNLLLRHLTATGTALVGLHTAISMDTPLPVPPYLRLCFEHALLQSPACEGTHLCDIVRISHRKQETSVNDDYFA